MLQSFQLMTLCITAACQHCLTLFKLYSCQAVLL